MGKGAREGTFPIIYSLHKPREFWTNPMTVVPYDSPRGQAGNENGMTELGVIPATEGPFPESRMLGNLHVWFGGGSGETQFGCALCSYLT
jgi:hypothetical protein